MEMKKLGVHKETAFEDLPDNWVCPVCGEKKDVFEIYENK